MSFDPTYPFSPPKLPPSDTDFRTPEILEYVIKARAELAELNGYSMAIPNPMLLMSPFVIQESVASSNIENINTTVVEFIQGQLFPETEQRAPDKEVARYRQALFWGTNNLGKLALSTRLIIGIQQQLLENSEARYRRQQNKSEVPRLMSEWEYFVNSTDSTMDPLIRCSLAHYQFEAIHPFSDGNGRTGRILMVLQLIEYKLLNFPVLFISGYLNQNRSEYYRLLRSVTHEGNWDGFIKFMLEGFYHQAKKTKQSLFGIMALHESLKNKMREKHKGIYSADLVDHLFIQPITTPVRLGEALDIHYTTASKYLHELTKGGILKDKKVGKYHLFANNELVKLLNK